MKECTIPLQGSPSQVEWAERIRRGVSADFDRVARCFRSVAANQDDEKRAATELVLSILEEKRLQTLSRQEAGYFIHEWQETSGKVRSLLFDDTRYQELRRAERVRNAGKADRASSPDRGASHPTAPGLSATTERGMK